MLISALVMAANRRQPIGQAVLGDAFGDLPAGISRLDVDSGAAHHGRKHRRDAGRTGGRGSCPLDIVSLPGSRERVIGQLRQQLA